jgi:hypothetical protein
MTESGNPNDDMVRHPLASRQDTQQNKLAFCDIPSVFGELHSSSSTNKTSVLVVAIAVLPAPTFS